MHVIQPMEMKNRQEGCKPRKNRDGWGEASFGSSSVLNNPGPLKENVVSFVCDLNFYGCHLKKKCWHPRQNGGRLSADQPLELQTSAGIVTFSLLEEIICWLEVFILYWRVKEGKALC